MNRRSRLSSGLILGLTLLASPAFAKTCPKIMFVLDQSASMAEDPKGGGTKPSKFDLLREATKKITNQWGDRVSFGLQLFKADVFVSCSMVSRDATARNCFDQTMIEVEPAHETAAGIITQLNAAKPVANTKTNTGEAIRRAVDSGQLKDPARDNFIILVSDGKPSCNCDDVMNADGAYTIDQINNARNQKPSIKTFVIGFDGEGIGVDRSILSDMASAGGAPKKGCGGNVPCYYSAEDAQKLSDALAKIIDTIVGGEFGSITCDDSCYSNPCPMGQVCRKSELDPVAKCQPDPCGGQKCSGDTFCRGGGCVKACKSGCKKGQLCVDGNCVGDPCIAVTCEAGKACCPGGATVCTPGECIDDLCTGRTCNGKTRCDPASGKCLDDQCMIITCPAGTTCQQPGNCLGAGTGPGKGGCTVGLREPPSDRGSSYSALALLALAGLALGLRRRRR